MNLTREICQNFFHFNLNLNKGHGIVPSLYDLIYRKEKEDPSYFKCLDKRISRESYCAHNLEDLNNVIRVAFNNISAKTTDLRNETYWNCLAHLFFVVDKIDSHARIILPTANYIKFKENAIDMLCEKIDQEYGDGLTNEKWYTLVVTENYKTNRKEETKVSENKMEPFDYTAYLMGIFTVYLINKL